MPSICRFSFRRCTTRASTISSMSLLTCLVSMPEITFDAATALQSTQSCMSPDAPSLLPRTRWSARRAHDSTCSFQLCNPNSIALVMVDQVPHAITFPLSRHAKLKIAKHPSACMPDDACQVVITLFSTWQHSVKKKSFSHTRDTCFGAYCRSNSL